jgi:hypothetical protein
MCRMTFPPNSGALAREFHKGHYETLVSCYSFRITDFLLARPMHNEKSGIYGRIPRNAMASQDDRVAYGSRFASRSHRRAFAQEVGA